MLACRTQYDDGDQAGDCKRDGKKPVTHSDAPDLLKTCSLKNDLMKDKAFSGFFVFFWGRFEYFFTVSKIYRANERRNAPGTRAFFEQLNRAYFSI